MKQTELSRCVEPQKPAWISQMTKPQQSGDEISIYAGEEPATKEQLSNFITTMAAAFPTAKPEFWAQVSYRCKRDRLSIRRLRYIYDYTTRNCEFISLKSILSADKVYEYLSYHDHYRQYQTTEAADGYESAIIDGKLWYRREKH